jgi:hypothetical protein
MFMLFVGVADNGGNFAVFSLKVDTFGQNYLSSFLSVIDFFK